MSTALYFWVVVVGLSSQALILATETAQENNLYLAHGDLAASPYDGRSKRTTLSFPIRTLLKGAKPLKKKLYFFTGRIYVKPNGFKQAQQDFWALNPKNVHKTNRPGTWIGDVQGKRVYLHRWEFDDASIQVKQKDGLIKRTILTVSYDMPRPWEKIIDSP